MSNSETERRAIEYVMEMERRHGRQPQDVRLERRPYDVSSPPRKIEVKAFGGSARGAPIPLEERQVQAAREDPGNFYVYVVDNIASGDPSMIGIRVLYGDTLRAMLDRAVPHVTYWPTFRVADYDRTTDESPGQDRVS